MQLPLSADPTLKSCQAIYNKVRQFSGRWYQIAYELESSSALKIVQRDLCSGSYPALPVKDFMLAKFIERIQTLYIPTTSRLLDLGAGRGKTLGTLASLLMVEGVGIEIRTDECAFGSGILAKMSEENWFGEHGCTLHLGNYFPANFIVDDEIKWGRGAPTISRHSEKDVYDEFGLTISDFDFIWAYQYLTNLPPTAALIGQRAASGTLVVFPGTTLEEIAAPPNITQVYQSEMGVIGRVK